MGNSKHEEWNNPRPVYQDNKRIAAGLLAILLGPLGIHKFLLGYTNEGIVSDNAGLPLPGVSVLVS